MMKNKVFAALAEGGMAEHLAAWRDGSDDKLRRENKYKDAADAVKALTGEEIKWANKIRKGVESYLVFAPVVTRVSEYEGRPQTGGCGKIGAPDAAVAGYAYLKTADRAVQNDKKSWTRTEQWTGADKWDADIYGGA